MYAKLHFRCVMITKLLERTAKSSGIKQLFGECVCVREEAADSFEAKRAAAEARKPQVKSELSFHNNNVFSALSFEFVVVDPHCFENCA